MEKSKFLEIEEKYNNLKTRLEQGTIDHEEIKSRLKKLMLRDEDGNYWMIGSNTGKWYIYNGKEWNQKTPYPPQDDFSRTQQFSHEESKAKFTEQENKSKEKEEVFEESTKNSIVTEESTDDKEEKVNEINLNLDGSETLIHHQNIDMDKSIKSSDVDLPKHEEEEKEESYEAKDEANNEKKSKEISLASASEENGELVNCIVCQSRIPSHSVFCKFCGANQKELGSKKKKGSNTWTITSINILSLIFFMGGLGLIFGVLIGASFGIFNIFNNLLSHFPQMLIETRGKIQGGLIFAAIGGLGGFILLSLLSIVYGFIYNSISYLFGGIKIKTR